MRIWLPGTPGLAEPPEQIAARARASLAAVDSFPVYEGPIALRIRFVYEFPGDGRQPTEEQRAAFGRGIVSSLAWYYCSTLDGLLYHGPEQIASLHAAKEYGRKPGVEVIA